MVARRIAAVCAGLVTAACCPNDDPRLNQNGGCECSGADGEFHVVFGSFCKDGAGETVSGPGVESEDNGSAFVANPISTDSWWSGTIESSQDQDWFTIDGEDARGSLQLEVDHQSGTEALQVDIGNSSTVVEGFVVAPGTTDTLTVGSELGRAHTFGLSAAAGPVDYRLRVSFREEPYELEDNSGAGRPPTPVRDGQAMRGRIADGADEDWFAIEGADGRTSLTWTVRHRDGAGPDLVAGIANGTAEVEGFPVAAGQVASLTVGSAFEQDHRLALSADAGVVPYTVTATFGDERVESEGNDSWSVRDELEAGEDWTGRVRNAGDVDWFGIAGAQSATTMTVEVESTDAGAPSLAVRVLNGSTEVDTFDVGGGSQGSATVPSAFEDDHRIELTAPAGPAPYRLRVTF